MKTCSTKHGETEQAEQRGWSYLSEASLMRVWDNDEDVAYDDWKDWSQLAYASIERAYGDDEPEYTEQMIREPNLEYLPQDKELS